MADTKISELAALTGANLADDDLVSVVDISDTTMAASGTNKKMTVTEFATGIGDEVSIAASQIASGTIDTARLGSGSASASTYLRGDQTWAVVTSVDPQAGALVFGVQVYAGGW